MTSFGRVAAAGQALGTIAVVTAWCGEDFTWVAKLLGASASVPHVWRKLIVYQKCAVYKTAKGYEVRLKATPIMMVANLTKAKQIAVEATGPDTTLTSVDVRRAIAKDVLLLKTYATAATTPLQRINDDRATYEKGVRATYKCAEGPPGGKWNLAAADTPPSNRVGRRAYRRAREELAMLEREARPKQKPVKTL